MLIDISQCLYLNLKRYFRHLLQKHANQSCKIHPGAFIDRDSKIDKYNVLFKNSKIINSTIGSHTYLQENAIINSTDAGKFCSFGSNVYIGLPRHKLDGVSTHPAFYLFNTPLVKKFCMNNNFIPNPRTKIGHDVWIGFGACIIAGLSIGTGCVIGAGAVVTKNVPPYAIVGGVPAKIIRYRFNKKTRKEIISTKWWNFPDQWIFQNLKNFNFPHKFLYLCKINDSSAS